MSPNKIYYARDTRRAKSSAAAAVKRWYGAACASPQPPTTLSSNPRSARVTVDAAALFTSIRRPLVQGALLSAAWRRRRAVRQQHALLRCAGDVPLSYRAAWNRRGDRCCAWLSAGESDSSRHVAHRPPPHHDGHGAPSTGGDQSSTYHRGRRSSSVSLVELSTRTVSPELCSSCSRYLLLYFYSRLLLLLFL